MPASVNATGAPPDVSQVGAAAPTLSAATGSASANPGTGTGQLKGTFDDSVLDDDDEVSFHPKQLSILIEK